MRIQTQGFDDAMQKLQAIDAIGRKIAGGGTFTIIGNQAAQSADKIERIVRSGNGAHLSLERVAHRAVGVGSAIAAAGEVGVSSMERITHATANVALGFGAQGAIVAAAAVAALAIVSIFTRARSEMEKTDAKARQILKALTLDTGAQRMSELFSGDVAAKPGTPASLGLERARARAAELTRTIPEQRFGAISGLPLSDQFDKQREELKELNKWILENGKAYDDTRVRVEQLTIAETDRARIVVEEGNRQRAQEAERLGLTRAMGAADEALHAADHMIDVIAQQVNMRVANEIAPNIEKILQDSVKKGMTELPYGGEGIASAGLNAPSGLMAAFRARAEALAEQMRQTITSVFGDAITQGFMSAFSGEHLGGMFKGLARGILSGLGSIFMQMGQKMVAASALMIAFQKAIASFFPGAGLVAGLALMALGAGMMAAGSVPWRGDAGGGGGGGGGGGYGSGINNTQEEITRVRLMPGWAGDGARVDRTGMYIYAPTIIGVNDPTAQRGIVEMYDKGKRQRG